MHRAHVIGAHFCTTFAVLPSNQVPPSHLIVPFARSPSPPIAHAAAGLRAVSGGPGSQRHQPGLLGGRLRLRHVHRGARGVRRRGGSAHRRRRAPAGRRHRAVPHPGEGSESAAATEHLHRAGADPCWMDFFPSEQEYFVLLTSKAANLKGVDVFRMRFVFESPLMRRRKRCLKPCGCSRQEMTNPGQSLFPDALRVERFVPCLPADVRLDDHGGQRGRLHHLL